MSISTNLEYVFIGSKPNMSNVLGFGQVEDYKSMLVIKEAAKQSDITSVFVSALVH